MVMNVIFFKINEYFRFLFYIQSALRLAPRLQKRKWYVTCLSISKGLKASNTLITIKIWKTRFHLLWEVYTLISQFCSTHAWSSSCLLARSSTLSPMESSSKPQGRACSLTFGCWHMLCIAAMFHRLKRVCFRNDKLKTYHHIVASRASFQRAHNNYIWVEIQQRHVEKHKMNLIGQVFKRVDDKSS